MVIDITNIVVKISLAMPTMNWRAEFVEMFLAAVLKKEPNAEIEWDKKAGEQWAVISKNGETFAVVCTIMPLVFYRKGFSKCFQHATKAYTTIEVDNFEDKLLTIDFDILIKSFGIRGVVAELVDKVFSVNDLYYWTV